MPTTYLWGKSGKYWHALSRHDPEYVYEEVESASLTAKARRKDPDAAPVMVRRPHPKKRNGPGTGRTLCGLRDVALKAIGVDPEKGDALCPSCQEHAKA